MPRSMQEVHDLGHHAKYPRPRCAACRSSQTRETATTKEQTMPTNFASHFETKTRADGVTFVTLADGAPAWLKDAVREAHQGTLPNDWVYAECRAAAEAVDSGDLDVTDEDDDDVHNHADAQVDVYTQDLFRWAADLCLTDTFSAAEKEAQDMGMMSEDTSKRLAAIQYAALRHIADTVKRACAAAAREPAS